jgi:hypothetical protein
MRLCREKRIKYAAHIFPLGVDTRGTVFQHRLQKQMVFTYRLVENFDLSLEVLEMFADLRRRDFCFKGIKLARQLRVPSAFRSSGRNQSRIPLAGRGIRPSYVRYQLVLCNPSRPCAR